MQTVWRQARLHGGETYPTTDDLGLFWRSVSDGKAVRSVINGPRITRVMSQLFKNQRSIFLCLAARHDGGAGQPAAHRPSLYEPRLQAACDRAGAPLCPISLSEGTLYILKGSHNWADLRQQFEGHDVDRDPSRPGHIEESAIYAGRTQIQQTSDGRV